MENKAQYQVTCHLTLAELRYGRVVGRRHLEQQVVSTTAEVNELFVDLCEQFRQPCLLGLQIVSIRRLQAHRAKLHAV